MAYTIDTTTPVLVTGGSGYVAGVLIEQLLKAGVTVHTTVRDATNATEKYKYLYDIATKYNGIIKIFSADLIKDGSFAEAMAGCSIVFHPASPFKLNVACPTNDLMIPAVSGTRNVLQTAAKTLTVKRVVLTSSTYAIQGGSSEGYDRSMIGNDVTTINEEQWNRTSSLDENPYAYSKVIAEQAAWVCAGSQTQYTLISINPGLIFGPGVIYHKDSDSYAIMNFHYGTDNPNSKIGGIAKLGVAIVDVRDVAITHIAAAYTPTASGRYVCVGHNTDFVEIAQVLCNKYNTTPKENETYFNIPTKELKIPKLLLWIVAPYISKGALTRLFVSKNHLVVSNFNTTKSITELNIIYRPLQDTCCEMYQQLIDNNIVIPQQSNDTVQTTNKKTA